MTESEMYKYAEELAESTVDCIRDVVVKSNIGLLQGIIETVAARNTHVRDLKSALKELIELAEIGDADLDTENWHPALENARRLLTPNG